MQSTSPTDCPSLSWRWPGPSCWDASLWIPPSLMLSILVLTFQIKSLEMHGLVCEGVSWLVCGCDDPDQKYPLGKPGLITICNWETDHPRKYQADYILSESSLVWNESGMVAFLPGMYMHFTYFSTFKTQVCWSSINYLDFRFADASLEGSLVTHIYHLCSYSFLMKYQGKTYWHDQMIWLLFMT